MLRKSTTLILLSAILSSSGIAKAEITSECSLSGNGDYFCTFTNKSKKKDNTCIRMVLEADYPRNLIFTNTGKMISRFENSESSMMNKLRNSGRDDEPGYIRPEISLSILDNLKKDREKLPSAIAKSEDDALYVSGHYLSNIRNLRKSGVTIDQFISKNFSTLSLLILAIESKGISNEICSGNIDANDVRERRGVATFTGVALPDRNYLPEKYASLNELLNNTAITKQLSPASACFQTEEAWDKSCSFSTFSEIEFRAHLKDAITSPQ